MPRRSMMRGKRRLIRYYVPAMPLAMRAPPRLPPMRCLREAARVRFDAIICMMVYDVAFATDASRDATALRRYVRYAMITLIRHDAAAAQHYFYLIACHAMPPMLLRRQHTPLHAMHGHFFCRF